MANQLTKSNGRRAALRPSSYDGFVATKASSAKRRKAEEEYEDIRLTMVSYIVLWLLGELGEATPYDLKQLVASRVRHLWALQHAQLYNEPERLARGGYVRGTQEQEGRRRKHYRLTDRGRAALDEWLAVPTRGVYELRDPGLLQLLLGADPVPLAQAQLEVHEAKLGEFEEIVEAAETRGIELVFRAGVGHEREWIRFWTEIARDGSKRASKRRRS
jgi:PadR family transcriptional regulator, regulatory protein AphA